MLGLRAGPRPLASGESGDDFRRLRQYARGVRQHQGALDGLEALGGVQSVGRVELGDALRGRALLQAARELVFERLGRGELERIAAYLNRRARRGAMRLQRVRRGGKSEQEQVMAHILLGLGNEAAFLMGLSARSNGNTN